MAEITRTPVMGAWISPLSPSVVATPGKPPVQDKPNGQGFAGELERASAAKPEPAAGQTARSDQNPDLQESGVRKTGESPRAADANATQSEGQPPNGTAQVAFGNGEQNQAGPMQELRRLDVNAFQLKSATIAATANMAASAGATATQKNAQTLLQALEPPANSRPAAMPPHPPAVFPTANPQANSPAAPAPPSPVPPPPPTPAVAAQEKPAAEPLASKKPETPVAPHNEATLVNSGENRPLPATSGLPQEVQLPPLAVKPEAVLRSSAPALAFVELRNRILGRIETGIVQLADKGDPRMVIRLYPPELGRVQVDMTVGDQGISVKINAESQAVREVILTNADVLKGQVENAGHTVESLSVEVGNFRDPAADGEGSQFGLGRKHRGGGGEEGDSSGSTIPDWIATSPLAGTGWLGRAINLIV